MNCQVSHICVCVDITVCVTCMCVCHMYVCVDITVCACV